MAVPYAVGHSRPFRHPPEFKSPDSTSLSLICFSCAYPPAFSADRYAWHTFYGYTADDSAYAVRVDASGDIYIAGSSRSSWLGDGGTVPLHAYSGDKDIFVLKLSKEGAYRWHTFYGSSSYDTANAIAVEADGDLLIAGVSSASWDAGASAPLNAHSGLNDIVVLRLSSSGAYQWHTFFGGSGSDLGNAVALADNGEALFVTGNSTSAWQGDQGETPKHAFPTGGSAQLYLLKLDIGGGYLWHTFYGGGWLSDGSAVAVDSSGSALVAGWSQDSWTGDLSVPPLHPHGGNPEIMILKLTSDGAYQWHTFYGSGSFDSAWGLAIDGEDQLLVASTCYAAWPGDNAASPLHAFSGASSIGVLKLDTDGAYQWHTFYGSVNGEIGEDLALDGEGGIYVSGMSGSSWLGDGGEPPVHSYQGGGDALIFKLDPGGAYQWHTFHGSDGIDHGFSLALDPEGHLVAAGESYKSWLGDSGQAPLHPHSPTASAPDLMVFRLVYLPHQVFLPLVVD